MQFGRWHDFYRPVSVALHTGQWRIQQRNALAENKSIYILTEMPSAVVPWVFIAVRCFLSGKMSCVTHLWLRQLYFRKRLEDFNTSGLQKQVQLQLIVSKETKRKPLSSVSATTGYFFIQSNRIVHMDAKYQSPKVGAYSLLPVLPLCWV